jgi:hypothetical protein
MRQNQGSPPTQNIYHTKPDLPALHGGHAISHSTPDATQITIVELSQLIAKHQNRHHNDDAQTLGIFGDAEPKPTDLEHTVRLMIQQGYEIGTPVRSYPARKRWHAECHVRVKTPFGEAILAFLVPLDVS